MRNTVKNQNLLYDFLKVFISEPVYMVQTISPIVVNGSKSIEFNNFLREVGKVFEENIADLYQPTYFRS